MQTAGSTYDAVVGFLFDLHAFDPDNPWEGAEQTPRDIDSLHRILRETLQMAEQALRGPWAYKCFDIPKGRGKTRRIEAPDGNGAILKIREELQWDIDAVQYHKNDNYFRALDKKFDKIDTFSNLRSRLAPGGDIPDSVNVVRMSQQTIMDILSPRLSLGSWVCGFRNNSWAYDGLRRILEPFYRRGTPRIASVYQIDIRSFFPSVTEKMATDGLFEAIQSLPPAKQLEEKTLRDIVRLLVQTGCYQWRLPQWGHLSPLLANCAAQHLIDYEIVALLKKYQQQSGDIKSTFSFGRYADDIVILSGQSMSDDLRNEIDAIVSKHFSIAEEKRIYQEWKKYYNIWWALLVADRQFDRVSFDAKGRMQGHRVPRVSQTSIFHTDPVAYTDFWFKLPKGTERRVGALALECAKRIDSTEGARELRDEWSPLAQAVRETVGYFSHAYNISRSGGCITLGNDGNYYGLPKPLLFAWEKLRNAVQQNFDPTIFRNTFIIPIEEDFDENRRNSEEHREKSILHAKNMTLKREQVAHEIVPSVVASSTPEELAEWVAAYNSVESDFFNDEF